MSLSAGHTSRRPLGLLLALLTALTLLTGALQAVAFATPAHADAICDRYDAGGLYSCVGTGVSEWNLNGDENTTEIPIGGTVIVPKTVQWKYAACSSWGGREDTNGNLGYINYAYPLEYDAICYGNYGGIDGTSYKCPPNIKGSAYGALVKQIRKTVKDQWVTTTTVSCIYPYERVKRTNTFVGGGDGRCLVKMEQRLYYSAGTAQIKSGGGKYVASKYSFVVGSNSTSKKAAANLIEKKLPGICDKKYTLNKDYTLPTYAPDSEFCKGKADGSSCRGYYRVEQINTFVKCIAKVPPTWTKQDTIYECDPSSTFTASPDPDYYTNSCKLGIEGGINANADFSPSACSTKWTCKISDTTINGQNKSAAVVAIRNGQPLRTVFPSPYFDGDGINENAVTNMKRKTQVVDESTPYNTAASVNSDKQFFVLYNAATGGEKVKFDTKNSAPYTAGSHAKSVNWLSFYWASDAGSRWQMVSTYTFDATFYNYNSKTLNGGHALKAEFEEGAKCTDYDKDVQYSYSPKVSVVRSVNTN